jgi:hypothetical protein
VRSKNALVGIGNVERAPRIARGMMRRDVEQLKVRLVRFDFARAKNLKAHIAPDAINLAQVGIRRVQAPAAHRTTGERHIKRRAGERLAQRALFHRLHFGGKRGFERGFDFVRQFASSGAFLFRQRA